MTEKKSYDRRNDESDSQWLGYQCYQSFGPGRTVKVAWEAYCQKAPKGVGKAKNSERPSGSFTSWYVTHKWADRARDWDADEEARKREIVISDDAEKYIKQLGDFRDTQVQSGKAGVVIGLSIKNKMAKFLTSYTPQTIVDVERLARILSIVERSGDTWAKALGVEQLLDELTSRESDA